MAIPFNWSGGGDGGGSRFSPSMPSMPSFNFKLDNTAKALMISIITFMLILIAINVMAIVQKSQTLVYINFAIAGLVIVISVLYLWKGS